MGTFTTTSAWHETLPHENGGNNTLYIHPISGNAIAVALFVRDNDIDCKIHFCDIMAGEQMQDWFLALNPQHTIPALCTDSGEGMWQTGALLRYFAKKVGKDISNKEE